MSLLIMNTNTNARMLSEYCKPHKIDTKSIISIKVDVESYFLEYINKDGHYCTMLVQENRLQK